MEKTEITVLTDEQINFLPDELKKDVVFLQQNMHQKDLIELNPLVSQLIKIEEQVKGLKFIKTNDGFDKKNIQEFTDVKKTIRSYRAAVKKAAKELKAPYQDVVKSIISIEKTFIGTATDLYDKVELEFKPYINFQELEKARKEEDKNKELLNAVKEQEAKNKEIEDQLVRQKLYNEIRYERINNFQNQIDDAISNGSISYLRSKIESLKYTDIFKKDEDLSCVSKDALNEIIGIWNEKKIKWLKMLSDRIISLQAEIDREIEKRSIPTPIAVKDIDVSFENVIVDSVTKTIVYDIHYIKAEGKKLLEMIDVLLKAEPTNVEYHKIKYALSIFE